LSFCSSTQLSPSADFSVSLFAVQRTNLHPVLLLIGFLFTKKQTGKSSLSHPEYLLTFNKAAINLKKLRITVCKYKFYLYISITF
jgi:hypothetical protein